MRLARTVIFDNEAVQALGDAGHRKHRRVIAALEVAAPANLRRAGSVRLVVPTTVRVEANWDRRRPGAASINRIRADDAPLDSATADRACALRAALELSVADAHLGAVIANTVGPVTVVTSDRADIRRIANHLGVAVEIVAL